LFLGEFLAQARGYASTLEAALHGNNIPSAVVENLIASTKADAAVAGYPDSAKLYVTAAAFGIDAIVRDDRVDYWDGE